MPRFDAHRLRLTGDLSRTGEMKRLLLEAGAPVDGTSRDDETPLMTAASYGDPDVLVGAGARVRGLTRGGGGKARRLVDGR